MKFTKYLDADKKHHLFVGVGLSLFGLLGGVANVLSAVGCALGSAVRIFIF